MVEGCDCDVLRLLLLLSLFPVLPMYATPVAGYAWTGKGIVCQRTWQAQARWLLPGALVGNCFCQRLRGGGKEAMGVNEHGAYDFRSSSRRMPPPIPMPPRSFFEVAVTIRMLQRQQNLTCTCYSEMYLAQGMLPTRLHVDAYRHCAGSGWGAMVSQKTNCGAANSSSGHKSIPYVWKSIVCRGAALPSHSRKPRQFTRP